MSRPKAATCPSPLLWMLADWNIPAVRLPICWVSRQISSARASGEWSVAFCVSSVRPGSFTISPMLPVCHCRTGWSGRGIPLHSSTITSCRWGPQSGPARLPKCASNPHWPLSVSSTSTDCWNSQSARNGARSMVAAGNMSGGWPLRSAIASGMTVRLRLSGEPRTEFWCATVRAEPNAMTMWSWPATLIRQGPWFRI